MSKPEQDVIEALDELADVINEKSGSTGKKTLSEMVEAARNIVTGTPTYAGDFTLAGDVKSIIVSTDVIDKAIEIYESGNLPYLKNSGALYKLTEYSSSGDSRSMQFAYTYSYDDLVGYWQAQLTYNVSTKTITSNVYSRYSNWSIQPNVAQQNSGALETLKFGDRVFSVGPTPNPQGESRYLLTSLGIWNTKYNLPNVLPNTAESSTRYLTSATINGAAYRVSNVTANPSGTASGTLSALNIDGTKYAINTVTANPSGTISETLSALKVNGTNYAIPQGTNVVANPTLAGTEANLTGLQVGDTKYAVPSGGGGNVDYVSLLECKKVNDELLLYANDSNSPLTSNELRAICAPSGKARINMVAVSYYDGSNYYRTGYTMNYLSFYRYDAIHGIGFCLFEGNELSIQIDTNSVDAYPTVQIIKPANDNREFAVHMIYDEAWSEGGKWRYRSDKTASEIYAAMVKGKKISVYLVGKDSDAIGEIVYFTAVEDLNCKMSITERGSGTFEAESITFDSLISSEGQAAIFINCLSALERIKHNNIFVNASSYVDRRSKDFSQLSESFYVTCDETSDCFLEFRWEGGSGSGGSV